jgi:hypothetical protein
LGFIERVGDAVAGALAVVQRKPTILLPAEDCAGLCQLCFAVFIVPKSALMFAFFPTVETPFDTGATVSIVAVRKVGDFSVCACSALSVVVFTEGSGHIFIAGTRADSCASTTANTVRALGLYAATP